MRAGVLVATVVAVLAALTAPSEAQRRTIVGQDQDVVLLPADASITIVRSLPGRLTVSSHEGGRVLVVLLDEGPQPDGSIDRAYRFDLEESFPRDYVWDGAGTLEEYEHLGERRANALGLVLPQGRVFLTRQPAEQGVPMPDAIATFTFTGHSSRTTRGLAADIEEQMLSLTPGRLLRPGAPPVPGSPDADVRVVPGRPGGSDQPVPRPRGSDQGRTPDSADPVPG